jgi:hypothetical protein
MYCLSQGSQLVVRLGGKVVQDEGVLVGTTVHLFHGFQTVW